MDALVCHFDSSFEMLSDDDSSSSANESIHRITVNEHFAKAYKHKKEREELQQLKEKYGSDAELDDETDSEEDESEDEDGEELTPAMDVAMLRTLAMIRSKNPAIYDATKNIFEDEQQVTSNLRVKKKAKDKSKALTIKQHALNAILDLGESRTPSPAPNTYVKDQELLKKETILAFKEAVASDSNDDELLVPREKTKDEIEQEEEEYREFLEREVGQIADIKELITVEEGVERVHVEGEGDTSMPRKKDKKQKKKGKAKEDARTEQSDKDFLLNYILNRGWVDRTTQRHPTYTEITTAEPQRERSRDESVQEPSKKIAIRPQSREPPEEELEMVEEEDEFDDLADRFESSYNFRFEEPGAASIATHPRNLPSLVRRQDTSRKEAREKRKQRKEEEKALKREEVNRLKALKMREIREKVDRIQKEGGVGIEGEVLKVLEEDIDEDWDPEKHDSTMRRLYEDDGAYAVDDDEKPHWADDIEIDDIIGAEDEAAKSKKKKRKAKDVGAQATYGEVDEDLMDAEVAHSWEAEEAQWDGTEESRKRLMDKYMDEVYGLDFNDMVGDLPTRFKYTTVPSASFALDPAEILMATDKELNEYMSIKRLAPYKNKNRGTWDKDRNEKLLELKQAVASRTWDGVPMSKWVQGTRSGRQGGTGGAHEGDGLKKKKRVGKKERSKLKALAGTGQTGAAVDADNGTSDQIQLEGGNISDSERPRKKRKKNKAAA